MAMRKFHWFENGKPVCNRKTSGYSAHSPGLANCLACRRVLRKRPTQRVPDGLTPRQKEEVEQMIESAIIKAAS